MKAGLVNHSTGTGKVNNVFADHHIIAEDYGQSQKLNHHNHNAVSASPTISKAQQLLDWKRVRANPSLLCAVQKYQRTGTRYAVQGSMEISYLLLCPTSRSTTGCIATEETFCTVFCHAMPTHQLPVSWPGSFKTVLCTTTWLLDCRFAPDGARQRVKSAVQCSPQGK